MYKVGQEVLITITDRDVTPPLVTTCRGAIKNPMRPTAVCNDGHAIWHGCELPYGRGITFAAVGKPKLAIVEHPRPVRCYVCRTRNTMATVKAPFMCMSCMIDGSARS